MHVTTGKIVETHEAKFVVDTIRNTDSIVELKLESKSMSCVVTLHSSCALYIQLHRVCARGERESVRQRGGGDEGEKERFRDVFVQRQQFAGGIRGGTAYY